jgi:hypothetical protein
VNFRGARPRSTAVVSAHFPLRPTSSFDALWLSGKRRLQLLPANYDGPQNEIKGCLPEQAKLLQPGNKVKGAGQHPTGNVGRSVAAGATRLNARVRRAAKAAPLPEKGVKCGSKSSLAARFNPIATGVSHRPGNLRDASGEALFSQHNQQAFITMFSLFNRAPHAAQTTGATVALALGTFFAATFASVAGNDDTNLKSIKHIIVILRQFLPFGLWRLLFESPVARRSGNPAMDRGDSSRLSIELRCSEQDPT